MTTTIVADLPRNVQMPPRRLCELPEIATVVRHGAALADYIVTEDALAGVGYHGSVHPLGDDILAFSFDGNDSEACLAFQTLFAGVAWYVAHDPERRSHHLTWRIRVNRQTWAELMDYMTTWQIAMKPAGGLVRWLEELRDELNRPILIARAFGR